VKGHHHARAFAARHPDQHVTVYLGDTVAVLPVLDPDSVDSIITDPPYGFGFCDQTWDESEGSGNR